MSVANPLIYKLIHQDSKNAIVFISGLGLDIKQQREAFVRRFACQHRMSYLALDCTKYAQSNYSLFELESEAKATIQTHFLKKHLFFTGACFGGNIAMRLANHFHDQTKAVIISSPAINYSEPSIVKRITTRIERKKQACQKKGLNEQLQQLLIFQQLVDKILPLMDYRGEKYTGPVEILHPQKDNFISVKNSENMLQELKRNNVSLHILPNETHTLRNDANLRLPILILEEVFKKCREN